MAVRSNVDGFVRKTRAVAAAIPLAERAGIKAAAAVAKQSILAAGRSRGAHVQERWVSIEDRGGTQHPQVVLQLRSAKAYWAEKGTKAHDVKPKRKKAVLTPQGPRASAHVRGARAKPFWHQGIAAGSEAASRAHAEAVTAALRKGFAG